MECVIVSLTENSVSSAHAQTVGTRLSFLAHTINSVHVGMRLEVKLCGSEGGGEEESDWFLSEHIAVSSPANAPSTWWEDGPVSSLPLEMHQVLYKVATIICRSL